MAKTKQYQHIDMQHNEVQNAKEHIVNGTPEDVVEGQHWYDSVSKRPKYYNGSAVKDYGKEYTAGTGITIDNSDETISVDTSVIAQKTDLSDFISVEDTVITNAITLADVATSGSYNDLKNKPTIPTVNNAEIEIQKNSTKVGSFTTNQGGNKQTINITVPTTASDVNALPDTTKYASSIDLTMDSSTYVITAQLKDQDGNNIGTAKSIDLPLESVVVSGSYDSTNKKVVLTLKDGSSVEFSVADLISGLQTEITSTNKLNSDLVDDTNQTHKFATSAQLAQIATNQTNIGTISTTLSGFGNIVTHNTGEFATASQGALADTALQSINSSMVTTALGYTPCKKITVTNEALTVSGGQATWSISNSLATADVGVHIYEISGTTYTDVTSGVEITVTSNTITVKMNALSTIEAQKYKAVIIG